MTLQRQIGFWLLTLATLVLALVVLRDVLLPFVAGLVLAYLMDPLADRLERLGFSRLGATVTIIVAVLLFLVLSLVLIVPLVAQQLMSFIAQLPAIIERLQVLIAEQGAPLLERLGASPMLADAKRSLGDLTGQAAKWAVSFIESLWSGGQAVVSLISLLVITPVVAFYLLMDWDHMVRTVDGWLPLNHRDVIRDLALQMNRAIAGFIRGQALVCLLLGLFYAIGLTVVGVKFGALIGLISGFLSFIPYVGSLTGLVLAVGVSIWQFWPDWIMPAVALAVFGVGQFLEGNVLSPKFVGASIGLHPVWLMFALVAFGSLFGFLGLLIAVPLAAVIGVLARFALRQYLASPLYHGGRSAAVKRRG